PKNKESVDESSELPESDAGRISDLIIPIAALFLATVGFIYWTGYNGAIEAGEETSLMNVFGESVVENSLLYGGLIGLLITFILFFRHFNKGKLTGNHFITGVVEGIKSMLPAFFILIFAWATVFLIEELKTGEYLGTLVQEDRKSTRLNSSHVSISYAVFCLK